MIGLKERDFDMTLNTITGRWVVDGFFIVVIGAFSFIANKADTKVERHETRIQAIEITNMRVETKLNYLIKSVDEIKDEIKEKLP